MEQTRAVLIEICHNLEGVVGTGPNFKGIWMKTEKLKGGGTAEVNAEYIKKSLRTPNADIVAGFPATMRTFDEADLPDERVEWLTAFIESLK